MRRLLPAIVALAAIVLTTSACPYQTTDTPICGDRLLPAGDACALWPTACGCAAGERCGYSGSAFACMTPGTQGVDAPCTDDSVCAEGTLCDGTRCRQACYESLDCGTDQAVACLFYDDAAGNQIAASCHRDCDPTSPNAPIDPTLETCLPDEACDLPASVEPSCVRGIGSGGQGATCALETDCQSGYGCVGTMSGGDECLRYCWIESPSACTGSETCGSLTFSSGTFSVSSLVLLGQYTLGVCQ